MGSVSMLVNTNKDILHLFVQYSICSFRNIPGAYSLQEVVTQIRLLTVGIRSGAQEDDKTITDFYAIK